MPRRDRRGEARVRKLLDQAKGERFLPGREEAALRRQEEAADLIRALAARHPDDPRHQQQLASTLYTLASMRTEAGQPAPAVAACDESESCIAAWERGPALRTRDRTSPTYGSAAGLRWPPTGGAPPRSPRLAAP